MNKYIIEILKIQSSIILPGFGSLMIANSKTGKIVFNPHLKFNDGALAKYIAEKEGLDVQASQNQVAKFVREIEAELAKGNGYDMFEFGSFKKGKDGNVEFEMHEKGAVIPNDAPKKAAEVKPKVEEKPKATEKVAEAPIEEKLDKKAAKARAKQDAADEAAAKKAADKAKELEKEQAKQKAKLDAEKAAADKKLADAKATEQTKADEAKKIADAKAAEVKKVEEAKQEKNVFVPAADKKTEAVKEEPKSDKQSAIERALGDPIKAAEIKTSTKKETPQEKNVFTPAEEKKAVGTSAAAAAALSAAGQKPVVDTTNKTEPVKTEAADKVDAVDPKAKKQKLSSKPTKEKKDGEKKKKNRWPLIIILIILLGGGGTAGFLFKDKIMAFINGTEVATTNEHGDEQNEEGNHNNNTSDNETTDTTEAISEEMVEEEVITEEVVEEQVVEEKVVEKVVDNSTGGNYHVIGNAFSESGNADAYVSQMKTKGFGSAKVLGRFDNLYMVSIQQFDSRSAAASGASSAGDGAWVFKWPK